MAIDVVINGALQALDLFTQERHGLDNRTGDQLRRSAQLALFLAVELALQVFGQGFTPVQQRTPLTRMQPHGLPGLWVPRLAIPGLHLAVDSICLRAPPHAATTVPSL